MAEKNEEKQLRIAIYETPDEIIEGGYGDFYNTLDRKKAIEKIAKGIHYYEWAHDKHFPKWDELNSDIQNDYKNMAKAALNALLSSGE